MFRFSVTQLLLLLTVASFTTALLVWNFWFTLVCLALAMGVAIGIYGRARRNTRLTRVALCLLVGSTMLLAYDLIVSARWIGTCGFDIEITVLDKKTEMPIDDWRARLLHRLEFDLIEESSSWVIEVDWTDGSVDKGILSASYKCSGSISGLGFFTHETGPPSFDDYVLVVEKTGYDRFTQRLSMMFAPGAGIRDQALPLLKIPLTRSEALLQP